MLPCEGTIVAADLLHVLMKVPGGVVDQIDPEALLLPVEVAECDRNLRLDGDLVKAAFPIFAPTTRTFRRTRGSLRC